MKYLKFMAKHFLVLLLPIAFLSSCEEEVVVYDGEDFVHFQQNSYSISEESAEPLNITVYRTSGMGTETVDFTVNASFAEGVTANPADYFSVQPEGSVTFADGEFEKQITIFPISNFDNTGALSIDIVLVNSSAGTTLGFPGESAGLSAANAVIDDDDCPFAKREMEGIYTVDEGFTSGTNAPNGLSDFFGESYQIELTIDESDASETTFIITNSDGFDTYFLDGTTLKFAPCSGTVAISNSNIALWRDLVVESATFDDSKFTITIAGDTSGAGPYQVVLTKQQ